MAAERSVWGQTRTAKYQTGVPHGRHKREHLLFFRERGLLFSATSPYDRPCRWESFKWTDCLLGKPSHLQLCRQSKCWLMISEAVVYRATRCFWNCLTGFWSLWLTPLTRKWNLSNSYFRGRLVGRDKSLLDGAARNLLIVTAVSIPHSPVIHNAPISTLVRRPEAIDPEVLSFVRLECGVGRAHDTSSKILEAVHNMFADFSVTFYDLPKAVV